MEFGEILAAVGGWSNVTAGALLVGVVWAVFKGGLTPPTVIRREDHLAAMQRITAQAEARVADAHARVTDALARAEKAEGREERWRDAWLVSETGRRLATAQQEGMVDAIRPLAKVLASEEAIRGLNLIGDQR